MVEDKIIIVTINAYKFFMDSSFILFELFLSIEISIFHVLSTLHFLMATF